MATRYRRRQLLILSLGIATSGCLDTIGQTGGRNVSTCSEKETWDITFSQNLKYNSNAGFSISASPQSVSFGDEITFRMRNETDQIARTGVEELYAIQQQVDDEWKNIFANPNAFDGGDHKHKPSEGYNWEFTIHPTKINGAWHSLCRELVPGKYRFVYFGLHSSDVTSDEQSTDAAVAQLFEIR